MSISLFEAVKRMEPGRTYQCRVQGRVLEFRIVDAIPPEFLPAPLVESDIMLDAWVELPGPTGGITLLATPGEGPLPDPPIIPHDEEDT